MEHENSKDMYPENNNPFNAFIQNRKANYSGSSLTWRNMDPSPDASTDDIIHTVRQEYADTKYVESVLNGVNTQALDEADPYEDDTLDPVARAARIILKAETDDDQ